MILSILSYLIFLMASPNSSLHFAQSVLSFISHLHYPFFSSTSALLTSITIQLGSLPYLPFVVYSKTYHLLNASHSNSYVVYYPRLLPFYPSPFPILPAQSFHIIRDYFFVIPLTSLFPVPYMFVLFTNVSKHEWRPSYFGYSVPLMEK